jgi:hypothetical protein
MSAGSGAGAVNVIVSKSAADTTIGSEAKLTATAGDLKLGANNDAWMLNASLAAAGSGGAAIGGAFNVNVFNRKFYWAEQGTWIRLTVSASGLRNINRMGLDAALKKAAQEGHLTEIKTL